jgi:hypothetical protein
MPSARISRRSKANSRRSCRRVDGERRGALPYFSRDKGSRLRQVTRDIKHWGASLPLLHLPIARPRRDRPRKSKRGSRAPIAPTGLGCLRRPRRSREASCSCSGHRCRHNVPLQIRWSIGHAASSLPCNSIFLADICSPRSFKSNLDFFASANMPPAFSSSLT